MGIRKTNIGGASVFSGENITSKTSGGGTITTGGKIGHTFIGELPDEVLVKSADVVKKKKKKNEDIDTKTTKVVRWVKRKAPNRALDALVGDGKKNSNIVKIEPPIKKSTITGDRRPNKKINKPVIKKIDLKEESEISDAIIEEENILESNIDDSSVVITEVGEPIELKDIQEEDNVNEYLIDLNNQNESQDNIPVEEKSIMRVDEPKQLNYAEKDVNGFTVIDETTNSILVALITRRYITKQYKQIIDITISELE